MILKNRKPGHLGGMPGFQWLPYFLMYNLNPEMSIFHAERVKTNNGGVAVFSNWKETITEYYGQDLLEIKLSEGVSKGDNKNYDGVLYA